MSLLDYYKQNIYDHGYYMSQRDEQYGTDHRDVSKDIYFNDEMDYNICADYYSESANAFTDEDIEFLKVLGFVPEDFEDYEG